MVVSYIIYFYSNLPSARVKNARIRSTNDTPWHVPPPPQRKSEIARLLRYGFFSLAVADAQDPWASADALNAGSEGLQRPLQNMSCTAPDACKMHQIRHSADGSDAAASAPVRPATRGHRRMRWGVLFRLTPRWPSESAYRRNALGSGGWYV